MPPSRRQCGVCRQLGHNRLTCTAPGGNYGPSLNDAAAASEKPKAPVQSTPAPIQHIPRIPSARSTSIPPTGGYLPQSVPIRPAAITPKLPVPPAIQPTYPYPSTVQSLYASTDPLLDMSSKSSGVAKTRHTGQHDAARSKVTGTSSERRLRPWRNSANKVG